MILKPTYTCGTCSNDGYSTTLDSGRRSKSLEEASNIVDYSLFMSVVIEEPI